MRKSRILFSKMKIVWVIMSLFVGCSKTEKFQLLEWRTGQWVAYTINGEPIKISIVGKDSNMFWIETVEPQIVVKALVEAGKLNEPKRLIVKQVGESPIEFQNTEFSAESGLPVMKAEDFGKKEIVVLPCGKFKVVHLKENVKDVWVSEAIPILGIAKYKSEDTLMVLQDYGLKGAKSEIAESVGNVSL